MRESFHGAVVPPTSQPRRLGSLRALAWAVKRSGWPRVVVEFAGGIGDQLLCSAIFRELRRRGGRRLWLMTSAPALFERNNDVDAVLPLDWRVSALLARTGASRYRPAYTQRNPATDRDDPPSPRHFIAQMCYQSGIRGEVALRPYLSLAAAEQSAGAIGPNQIVIQSSGMAARYPIGNKEWLPERFAEVAATIAPTATLVQLGSAADPLLPGARDLRGQTTLRESAAILSQSRLYIGLAGLLMHLARAVDCRSVVVFGGREDPVISGYSCNENLFTAVPCAPCWLWNRCDFDHRCMTAITAADVLAAVERQNARFGTPLPVATWMVE